MMSGRLRRISGLWRGVVFAAVWSLPFAALAQSGSPGQALYFGGTTNDRFFVNSFTGFPSTAFTIESWVWTSNQVKFGTPFSYAVSGVASDANEVALFNTRDLQSIVANLFAPTNAISVNDGQWHHLAMSWTNSGELRFYKDGILVGSNSGFRTDTVLRDFGYLVLSQEQDSYGGSFDSAQALEGQLDDVRLWSVALSEQTIQSNKNLSLSGQEPHLIAYYRFDEAGGLVASNSAANLNHGTLNGVTTNRVASSAPIGLAPIISASHTGVWPVAVTLRASINPNGSDTAWWFEWGPGTNLLHATETGVVSAAYTTSLLSRVVTDLPAGTTVTYRLCASNITGVKRSPAGSFNTPTNFVVATTNDHVSGSLREAIAFARSNEVITLAAAGTFRIVTQNLVIAQHLTLRGTGPTNHILEAFSCRHILVQSNITAQLEGLSLIHGNPFVMDAINYEIKSGGAILNYGTLAVTGCIFRGNTAGAGGAFIVAPGLNGGWGGAIYSRGALTLDRCAFYANQAGTGSAGINFSIGGTGGSGGALYAATSCTMNACVFIGNRAGNGGFGQANMSFGTPGIGGDGGSGGAIFAASNIVLLNCTMATNVAGNGGDGASYNSNPGTRGSGGSGGALHAMHGGTLVHCTVVDNQAGAYGSVGVGDPAGNGGGLFVLNGQAALINTLIASNRVTDGGTGPDAQGAIASLGHNLLGIVDGSTGLTNGVDNDYAGSTATPLDPVLGALVYTTNAIAGYLPPDAGSFALEGGDDVVLGAPYLLTQDVRGFARKSGARVDIGSYETDAASFIAASIQPGGVTGIIIHPAGATDASFGGAVTPGTVPSMVFIEYGLSTAYGQRTTALFTQGTNVLTLAQLVPGLLGGYTYHYRVVASNAAAVVYGPDQTYTPPAVVLPGDLDGDGIIAQDELDAILPNYWINSPYLDITEVVGAGTSNVVFALPNPGAWAFTVEVSTNLSTWTPAGDANPAYLFHDNAASNAGTRYYRLAWP